MVREIEEDLLQDLQWNGIDLRRREELSNHFSLHKLPQEDLNGLDPDWNLEVGQTLQT